MQTRKLTLFGAAVLFWPLSLRAAEIVDVPVTLPLDPPAASAPGVNHLRIDLNGGLIGSDSDDSQLTGSIEAIVRLDVDDPDNPVIVGVQFLSGDIHFADTSFNLFTLFISDIDIAGTGISGTIVTPSGKLEPVSANAFDSSLHMLNFNQGILTATGSVIGFPPVNEVQDLSASPLGGSGSGTGTTSIANVVSTPTHYTYAIGMAVPVLFVEAIPVGGGAATITTTINGSLAATGQVTVVILPKLKPVIKSPTGFELEITGKVGANVVLCASENLTTWIDIVTLTLALPVTPYLDPGAIGLPERYYRFREP